MDALLRELFFSYSVPVSYTHLDVYKRQLFRMRLEMKLADGIVKGLVQAEDLRVKTHRMEALSL